MNLEQYLEEIRNCPNEEVDVDEDRRHQRLYVDFGITDNYFIGINTNDMITLAEALQDSGKYKIISPKRSIGPRDSSKKRYLEYVPGIISIRLANTRVERIYRGRAGIWHHLTLHPYSSETNSEPYRWHKAMVNAIIDLVEVMKAKQILFCLESSWYGSKVKKGQEIPHYP